MQDLTDLYQTVLLDHNRRPRNYRVLPTANRVGSGNRNPMQQSNTTRAALDSDIRCPMLTYTGLTSSRVRMAIPTCSLSWMR